MRTQRFVEVPAPLEERVSDSVLSRLRDALLFGAEARDRLNQTVHDEHFKERAAVSVVDALRLGGATSVLLLLLGVVVLARWWAVRRETRRILCEHGVACERPKGE
jgi:hypothetical protein